MFEESSSFGATGVGLHAGMSGFQFLSFSVTQTFHDVCRRKEEHQKKVRVSVAFSFVVNFILVECVAYEHSLSPRPRL